MAGLFTPWEAAPVSDGQLVVLNEALAVELGLDVEVLRTPDGVAALVGQRIPAGTVTIAQAYAGHQFGGFSPSLGDGRALLLGELVDGDGRCRDVHLKGSGATPYSRGGDGKAALGPMLREHLVSEAMHALGIPTTRALAVVATGEPVVREVLLPGAILVRVASSHLRVGSFQYAAAHGDTGLVQRLADHAIARHYPSAAGAEQPYVALFEAVVEAQAALVAQWMLVGFVHGVMNTDNMTISGETIDYGPCAFMEAFNLATVFSSIDHGGRYAYGQQPRIAHWNLARFGEAMLPLLATELEPAVETANGVLATFAGRYEAHWLAGNAGQARPGDGGIRRCRAGQRAAGRARGAGRRHDVGVPSTCRRRRALMTRRCTNCSPNPPHMTLGCNGGALASTAKRDRPRPWRRRWIASTPSTSHVTSSSRTHSRPPWTATSYRTSSSSPPSRTRSTSGRATSATPCPPTAPPPIAPSAEPELLPAPNCLSES